MKIFKRTLILVLFFLFIFNFKVVNAIETVDFDVSQIADNFNKSSYVSELQSIGTNINATQNGNSVIVNYNGESLEFNYNESDSIFSVSYPYSPADKRKNCDIMAALFIDTISVMQGNEEGSLLPFALSDSFCLSYSRDMGLEKNYGGSGSGRYSAQVSFTIIPTIKLSLPTAAAIDLDSYYSAYETFYTKNDCVVTQENLLFYKTYNTDGLMEIYVGEPNELTSYSYDSFQNAISILFGRQDAVSPEVKQYFSENYSDFSKGNFEFEGINVVTDNVKLPIKTAQTILTSKNMKYAKITLDENLVNEKIKDITVVEPEEAQTSQEATKKASTSERIIPLVISCIIVFIVFMMIMAGILLVKD